MRAGLLMRLRVTAAPRGATVVPMDAVHSLPLLADVTDCQRRDGPPQLVIRRKHPVVAMPVLPRRRHEIGEPVEELNWRELDNAIGPRPGGLSAAAGPDPVGGFVPGQHVTDAGDATARVTSDKEPLEREGWPGAGSEKMLKWLTIDTHLGRKSVIRTRGVD